MPPNRPPKILARFQGIHTLESGGGHCIDLILKTLSRHLLHLGKDGPPGTRSSARSNHATKGQLSTLLHILAQDIHEELHGRYFWRELTLARFLWVARWNPGGPMITGCPGIVGVPLLSHLGSTLIFPGRVIRQLGSLQDVPTEVDRLPFHIQWADSTSTAPARFLQIRKVRHQWDASIIQRLYFPEHPTDDERVFAASLAYVARFYARGLASPQPSHAAPTPCATSTLALETESSIQAAMHAELRAIREERDMLRCELVDSRAEVADYRELQTQLTRARARVAHLDREMARLSDARLDAHHGDCSLFPDMRLPPKFKIPEFKTYEGATDSRHHLRYYRGKMLQYWEYEEFVIHSFQDSLSGSALDWFMSLKAEDIPTWEDLSRKVPWTYEGSVGNLEQQFDVMGITRSGRLYENPATTDKGKAPVTEEETRPRTLPTPSKKVTEEEAEAFMKVIKVSEYKVVEQMAKSPAHISLLALLLNSEPHREALIRMNVDLNRIRPSKTAVRAFDGSRREVNGEIDLLIDIGPCSFSVTFQVLDIPNAFSLLLGRPWIHSLNRGIPVPPLSHFFPGPPLIIGSTSDGPSSDFDNTTNGLPTVYAVTEEIPSGVHIRLAQEDEELNNWTSVLRYSAVIADV
ncbi:hypothetical protein CRG98_016881 [Punica granatum]|uniref:Retrotransposon gag domain-containing protein n=1 Tax=Punica granatum TaxID=22663 RepID=A0A2I0K2E2_PUNGR|nr:hypothetical protein CRG98_016881 [Punica granatum]